MSTYFIGDIHGCYKNLKSLLNLIQFNPNIDMLYLTGDLISRGPNSLEVLRLLKSFNKNACTVLGNHDLYLLKTYFLRNHKKIPLNHFQSILHAPDVDNLIHWLRRQPILYINETKKLIISHAGIHPQWNIQTAKLYAQEIETILTSDYPHLLFYETKNLNNIQNSLINVDKLKKIQNNIDVFTKMRYVLPDGRIDLKYNIHPKFAPKHIYPWFSISNLKNSNYNVIFGHWSSLQNTDILPVGFYGLDSGCCWKGYLTSLRWEDKKITRIHCNPPT